MKIILSQSSRREILSIAIDYFVTRIKKPQKTNDIHVCKSTCILEQKQIVAT